jgi:mannosyltransferase OCH1-like enzyme
VTTPMWEGEEQSRVPPGEIPHTLHVIWNHSEMPQVYREHAEEFQRLHPDWVVVVWHDKMIKFAIDDFMDPALAFVIKHAYGSYESGRSKDKRQVSDLLRFAVIWQFGGVYLDCDITPFRNMDHLFSGAGAVLTCEMKNRLANSVVAGEAKNEFIDFCTKRLFESYLDPSNKNIFTKTGPVVLTDLYWAWLAETGEAGCRLLDKKFFYPYAANSKFAGGGADDWPEAVAAHRWASRQGQGGLWSPDSDSAVQG